MKMSYRDRMIALVGVVVALVLIGIFVIVKPMATKISSNKATLASVKSEEDRINGIIEQLPTLADTINTEYNDSKSYAEGFAQSRVPYEVDQFIQEYFNTNQVEVLSLATEDSSAETIEFYSYTPNVVTYPLLEAADINGDIATATAEKLKTSTVFSNLEAQEVEMYSLTIGFNGKKDNILALLDAIKDIDENVLITQTTVDDFTFGANAESGSNTLKGYSTGSMTINFYVLEPLSEPVLG